MIDISFVIAILCAVCFILVKALHHIVTTKSREIPSNILKDGLLVLIITYVVFTNKNNVHLTRIIGTDVSTNTPEVFTGDPGI
jgi:hypothetical protein